MKINGFYPISNSNIFPVEALNLRDGQKIIAKVISASADEALLEMAGHNIHAKIEGEPEVESGAVLKFLVNHDQQGRVLLKIISNDQPVNNFDNLDTLTKQAIDPNLQKAITTALTKEGLPVNQENLEKFIRLLQGFENKYQQTLPPQVLAFISANKWPINPETIMTAWVYQDTKLRDFLWNLLRQSGSDQSGTNVLARLMLGITSKPEELQAKLETLFKQIETIIRYVNKNESDVPMSARQIEAGANGLFRQSLLKDDAELNQLLRQLTTKPTTEAKLRQSTNPNSDPLVKTTNNQTPNRETGTPELKGSLFSELKQLVSKLASTFEQKDLGEKIEVLLDRNLALTKTDLQENSPNGNYNLIPFLVNDSQGFLHEVLIKWQEQSKGSKDGISEQVLQMNIPTENLGEINLTLRTGRNGTQITFKVDHDFVRKYLLRNLAELRTNVKGKNLLINVALEAKGNLSSSTNNGVDLWI